MMKKITILLCGLWMTFLTACQLLNQEPQIIVDDHFTYEYNVYSTEPDWLKNIKVIDKEDGTLKSSQIKVDSSDIKWDTIGEYTLFIEATDSKGKSSQKELTIQIRDLEKPEITLLGDETIELPLGYPYIEPGYEVEDNVDDDLVDSVTVDLGGLDIDEPGTYTLTYTVKDKSGNVSEPKTRIVKVVDDLSMLIDDNLERVIRNYLLKPEGKITKRDAESITSLVANYADLTSLKGLEYLTELKIFTAMHNKIVDLTPLSNLTKLEQLNLSYNQIRDLSPLENLSLKQLSLTNNRIKDVSPLADLTTLTDLNLANNEIELINSLSPLIHLNNIRIDHNNIRDVSVLKTLYENGAFQGPQSNIHIDQNPIELEVGQPSYLALMYFIDHGIRFQYANPIPTEYYKEDYTSAKSLTIGVTENGFIGYPTDIDWYRFYLPSISDIELLIPKHEAYMVHFYELRNGELIPLQFDREETVNHYLIKTELNAGMYYISIESITNISHGYYDLLVRHPLTSE